MFKNNTLTIDYKSWQNGIAPSAYAGIEDMRNIDPHTKPVALLCGKKAIEESDGALLSLVRYTDYDQLNNIVYGGTENGQLVQRTSGGTWSDVENGGFALSEADECNGLTFWKGHLLYSETNTLNVLDIDAPFWYADWQTFAEGTRGLFKLPHTSHIGQDDVVYFCDGKYIASLQEVPLQTFDPGNAATYTWNSQALDLPDNYVANTLTEYGQYLIIGSYYGEILNRGNRADTFPWDRTSASFNIPTRAMGNGVLQSINHNNRLFTLLDRTTGRLAATNLSSYEVIRELRELTEELKVYPDAIDVLNNEILMGIGSQEATQDKCGVYGYKDGFYHLKNVLSCGDTQVEIGSIAVLGEGDYIATWQQGSSYGADIISDIRTDGYESYFDTAYYEVATPLNPKQFQNLNLHLGKKLTTGQGVKVAYRTSLADSFTEIAEVSFATHGAVSEGNVLANIPSVSHIQLRISMTTLADSTDSPEFIRLELY